MMQRCFPKFVILCYGKARVWTSSLCTVMPRTSSSRWSNFWMRRSIRTAVCFWTLVAPGRPMLRSSIDDYFAFYEQYATILLFVQIFVRRFDLTSHELRLDPSGFTSSIIAPISPILSLQSLTPEESGVVGAWLRCLLDGNGIGDDMYAKYQPAQTHRLAATIFDQCLRALAAGLIEWEPVQEMINCEPIECSPFETGY